MSTLTPSQQQAIKARGNVLVVAGAGTGKTSTLVHRCVSLLLEEDCSLDEILMVTFTEAAAAQMRSRIRAELRARQKSLPEDAPQAEKLQKQLALLDTAHICTLHSFCLELVRTHFYQLGLDPAVMVLDERQTAPLISQTLDALFNRYYESDTLEAAAVQELITQLGGGADEQIRDRLVRLHRYTQALDDPAAWLAAQESLYQEQKPVAWRCWFQAWFDEWRNGSLPELRPYADVPAVERFIGELASLPNQPTFEGSRQALRRLREADEDDKNWPRGTKTKVRQALNNFVNEVEFLASAIVPATVAERASGAGLPPDEENDPLVEDWGWVRAQMCTLLRLTREFTAAFGRAKRDLGGVDFADLEQLAIRLLREPAIAQQWQQRLRFIFVDECQDINRAQDAIITALSRETTQPNRFLVGDVKQSIYRFRLANPKIFCAYEELWRSGANGGSRIPLADNFRSREALLHFINPLFAAVMRAEVGGVAYEPDVHLRFGSPETRTHLSMAADARRPPDANTQHATRNTPEAAPPRVELHLIDHANAEGEPADNSEDQSQPQAALLDLMTTEREARLVAMRLQELRDQKHLIYDPESEQFRPVEWRDMVVLMRSPSGRVEAFAKEFNQLGIPLSAARSGFFSSIEISDLLSLLKLIDNPLQDVPLLAVLRSPLVGVSLDELGEIRAHNREKPFWTALKRFHHHARSSRGKEAHSSDKDQSLLTSAPTIHSAWSKVDAFLGQFEDWRELARQSSLSLCLETVLAATHYEALLLAEPRGEERVANVNQLLELAREYDPYRRQGLYRFLRFVEAQQDAEVELEPATAQTDNAVRLVSIHKSKGLEFPVVVLAGLGVQFNMQDLRKDMLLHETYGLCPKVKPPGADRSYPSLPYWFAARDEKRELLGEELRLLYVALTRARDTLILTGSCKKPRWDGSLEVLGGDTQLSIREILSARSCWDWLRMWLPRVTAPADWLDEQSGQAALLRWRIYAANDPQLLLTKNGEPGEKTNPELDGELDEMGLLKLQERMLWRYPFSAATVEPAVKRISAVIREQPQAGSDAQLLFNYDASTASRTYPSPWKRPGTKLAAVDIGSAHHRFLEMLPLEQVDSLECLRREAARMIEAGGLTSEEIEALDFEALLAFWHSDVGRKILSEKPNVHREIPFTARFSPDDFASLNLCPNAADLKGEYFVVRGKADLAVLLPKEIWLVDFKTDQLSEPETEEKVRQYAPQLKLYALGLSRIYHRPVTHCWLHFLARGQTISI